MTFYQAAQHRWPQAEWITGNGRYASVSSCRHADEPCLTVMLWKSRVKAEEAKAMIDRFGCGGQCSRRHTIADLGRPAPSPHRGA